MTSDAPVVAKTDQQIIDAVRELVCAYAGAKEIARAAGELAAATERRHAAAEHRVVEVQKAIGLALGAGDHRLVLRVNDKHHAIVDQFEDDFKRDRVPQIRIVEIGHLDA